MVFLALGGGSVCDYSKAVAASVFYDGDYWDKFLMPKFSILNPKFTMTVPLDQMNLHQVSQYPH